MKRGKPPQTVAAGVFKATCLALLDEVARSGRSIIVTKRGRPVAQVGPAVGRQARTLAGSVTFCGDVVSALEEGWDADT